MIQRVNTPLPRTHSLCNLFPQTKPSSKPSSKPSLSPINRNSCWEKGVKPQISLSNVDIVGKINTAKEEGTLFVRCVREPDIPNGKDWLYPETNMDIEARKTSRQPGKPTKTKLSGTKQGNILRSTSLVGNNTLFFSCLGLGIIDPNVKDIMEVSDTDLGVGYGKHEDTPYFDVLGRERTADEIDKVKIELEKLRQFVKSGKHSFLEFYNDLGENTYQEVPNEVLLNIKPDKVSFIFFNPSDRVFIHDFKQTDNDYMKLMAIYMQRVFDRFSGKKLSIVSFDSSSNGKITEFRYTPQELDRLLEKSFNNDLLGIEKLCPLAKVFEEEISKNQHLINLLKYYSINAAKDSVPEQLTLEIRQLIQKYAGDFYKNLFDSQHVKQYNYAFENTTPKYRDVKKYIELLNELCNNGNTAQVLREFETIKNILATLMSEKGKPIDVFKNIHTELKSLNKDIREKIYNEKKDLPTNFFKLLKVNLITMSMLEKGTESLEYITKNDIDLSRFSESRTVQR